MSVQYIKAQQTSVVEAQIDALIDDHTREIHPTLEDQLEMQYYAIEARLNDEFIGGIAFRKQHETAHVGSLGVAKDYRQQNIGRQLILEMERYCTELGVHTVSLSTLNYQALPFYLKQGFQQCGEITDFPKKGMTKYFLFKRLPNYF